MTNDLLPRLQAAQSDEEREWLVMQFSLESVDPGMREAVWVAAIPHWFDGPFLTALLDEPEAEIGHILEKLVDLSFVEPFPGRGYNVHKRSRTLLLTHLWRENPDRYRNLSRRALAFAERQNHMDVAWRIEIIYHQLVAEPDNGVSLLVNTGWEWHSAPNFAYDKVEMLARAAREHADTGCLTPWGLGWTLFWEGLLDLDYQRLSSAKSKFLQIQTSIQVDPYLAAERALHLAAVYQSLNEYEAARQRFDEAIAIYRSVGDRLGEANCFRTLGTVRERRIFAYLRRYTWPMVRLWHESKAQQGWYPPPIWRSVIKLSCGRPISSTRKRLIRPCWCSLVLRFSAC
jgi:tetratricopeptide (TPR) repeat protein